MHGSNAVNQSASKQNTGPHWKRYYFASMQVLLCFSMSAFYLLSAFVSGHWLCWHRYHHYSHLLQQPWCDRVLLWFCYHNPINQAKDAVAGTHNCQSDKRCNRRDWNTQLTASLASLWNVVIGRTNSMFLIVKKKNCSAFPGILEVMWY